jgi:hypothetical protein
MTQLQLPTQCRRLSLEHQVCQHTTSPCRLSPLDRLVLGLVRSMVLQYLLLGRAPLHQTLGPEVDLQAIDRFKMVHIPHSQLIRMLRDQHPREALRLFL